MFFTRCLSRPIAAFRAVPAPWQTGCSPPGCGMWLAWLIDRLFVASGIMLLRRGPTMIQIVANGLVNGLAIAVLALAFTLAKAVESSPGMRFLRRVQLQIPQSVVKAAFEATRKPSPGSPAGKLNRQGAMRYLLGREVLHAEPRLTLNRLLKAIGAAPNGSKDDPLLDEIRALANKEQP